MNCSMEIIESISKKVHEALCEAKDKELSNFLAEYNLTPQNMRDKGYVFTVEYKEDGIEVWNLSLIVKTESKKFTVKYN